MTRHQPLGSPLSRFSVLSVRIHSSEDNRPSESSSQRTPGPCSRRAHLEFPRATSRIPSEAVWKGSARFSRPARLRY